MAGHLDSYRLFFVNNCLFDVFSGLTQWFTNYYFTEFKTVTLGSYDRTIREIQNSLANQDDAEKAVLPAFSLNPFGDMATDEKFPHLWRTSIGERLQDLYMDPQYEDDYFGFSVITNRFKGNFECILYLQSPYEYFDHYIQLIMWFHGGFNRRVRPGLIRTHAIIPSEVIDNAYDGTIYDWSNSGISTEFVKVLNSDHYLYPMDIGPQIWLTSLSNASTVYGDDGLSQYKIQLTCEYDIDLPTHIIVRNADRIENVQTKISTGEPVFVPQLPVFTPTETTVVVDEPELEDTPPEQLGPPEFFKTIVPQVYHEYIMAPEKYIRPCNQVQIVHHATLQWTFANDLDADSGFQIDISSVGIPVDSYDKIVIGDRTMTAELIYGNAYEVDTENTGYIITVKMPVTAGTIWDILVYKDE